MCRFFSIFFLVVCLFLVFPVCISAIDVSAKGAFVLQPDTNDTVFSKNADTKMSMASTTKIMTAIVAIENCKLDTVFKIPKEAVGIEGSSIYLKEGEMLTIEELLYALLLESANDASVALAIACSGSVDGFVSLMNEKAVSLGLINTHFTNPHGLDDDEHYTTPRELALIASYAMKNPVFKEISSTYKKVIPLGEDGSRVLINHNRLLRSYTGAIGVKTGFTRKSGRCLVSCAERDGVRLIAVTLNAPNDWNDHKEMLDLGFECYENIVLAKPGDYSISLDVINGAKSNVVCTNYDALDVTLKKENIDISASLEANHLIASPISKGDLLGKIVFKNNGVEIASLPLYATENIKQIKYKKSIFERIFG